MKFTRTAVSLLATAAALTPKTTTAYTAASTSSLGGSRRAASSFLSRNPTLANKATVRRPHHPKSLVGRTTTGAGTTTTTTGLSMNFMSNFFGGGAYGQSIPYEDLDFPGPELATAALSNQVLAASPSQPHLAVATFAGGCFWGLELAFQRVPGVTYTAVGYTQGPEERPTYEQVCAGATRHTEAVIVYYDPTACSYESLLDTFFGRVNPTTVNGQGMDRGPQYRTGVYTHTAEQADIAYARFAEMEQALGNGRIATELLPAQPFWPAEKYHQQYLAKGGRFGEPQDASKGATSTIRCYG